MKPKCLLIYCALFFAFGCGQKSAETSSAGKTPEPGLPNSSPGPAVHNTRTAVPVPAPQPAAMPADASAALGALTEAVRRFGAEKQRVPKDLNEVISAGYIRNMPPAPPGKKFVLNTQRLEITLEDN